MTEQLIIKLEGVAKTYGRVQALHRVDLEVRAGELFGFLGPNAAGKTTVIRILLGFIRANEGIAQIFGLDAWRDSIAIKGRVGFLPDFPPLYDNMSGAEYLDYLGVLHRRSTVRRREQLCELLEIGKADIVRRIKGYSRGMKQKLGIIQALQHDPELLVLDEPTESLDPLIQVVLFDLLREFQAKGGTVFMSSHTLPEVEQLCQRVGMIREGEVVAVEDVQELRGRQLRILEVKFKGNPPDKFDVPGTQIVWRDGSHWRLQVKGDINALLRELARHDLADMVFEPVHLNEVFMQYYKGTS
jgi:ABC-2 type transport system ATP-binding protein